MKSTFTLNTHIATALVSYDLPKLINAVQASLNSAELTEEGESRRGNVKLVKSTEGVKAGAFTFSETSTDKYRGKTDAPARFARWHDSMATVFKKAGEPSGELTAAIVPAGLKVWLDEKFSLAAKAEVKPTGNGARRIARRNARRNGEVKPNIPTPSVPA